MRILLIEDHPLTRFGIQQLLLQRWPNCQIGECTTLAAGLEQARARPWDIALLDLSLADAHGLEALVQLHRAVPSLPILVLSMHAEAAYAARALQHGAAGYLAKDRATDELPIAISRITAGHRYISQSLAESLAGLLAGVRPTALPHEVLSAQEHRVMLLIASGFSTGEIAARMHLSAKTIGTYRSRIIEKTGLSSSAEIARYCQAQGLLLDG
jgi:DNA-binding NarL/FixJ family response regulator